MVVVRLYHFTAPYRTGHLGAILRDGRINTTESNVSRTKSHVGPDVVWLTNQPKAIEHLGWATLGAGAKVLGRITVELPAADVRRWSSFCVRHKVKASLQAGLAAVGGSDSWYVVERSIEAREWVAVERYDGAGWRPIASWEELPEFTELREVVTGLRKAGV